MIEEFMRILMCHPGAEEYGSDRMGAVTAAGLSERGHVLHFVIPEEGALCRTLESLQVETGVMHVPVLRKQYLAFKKLPKFLFDSAVGLARALRLLRTFEPDVVYVNTCTQPVWILSAWMLRYPVVVHVREAESGVARILRTILTAPLVLATGVIANSNSTRNFVSGNSPVADTKIRVIYNGKNWAEYQIKELVDWVPFATGPVVMSLVGRVSPRKGQDLAIAALADLVATGLDLRLRVIGDVFSGYEWYLQSLRDQAESAGVADRVDFLGFRQDVAQLLAETDIVLIPSRVEPFGSVAVEAMAAGVPVIASDIQGLGEIVRNGINGFLHKNEDTENLAQQIRHVIYHPHSVNMVRDAAVKDVKSRFSEESYLEAVEQTLVSAVRRGNVS